MMECDMCGHPDQSTEWDDTFHLYMCNPCHRRHHPDLWVDQ